MLDGDRQSVTEAGEGEGESEGGEHGRRSWTRMVVNEEVAVLCSVDNAHKLLPRARPSHALQLRAVAKANWTATRRGEGRGTRGAGSSSSSSSSSNGSRGAGGQSWAVLRRRCRVCPGPPWGRTDSSSPACCPQCQAQQRNANTTHDTAARSRGSSTSSWSVQPREQKKRTASECGNGPWLLGDGPGWPWAVVPTPRWPLH